MTTTDTTSAAPGTRRSSQSAQIRPTPPRWCTTAMTIAIGGSSTLPTMALVENSFDNDVATCRSSGRRLRFGN